MEYNIIYYKYRLIYCNIMFLWGYVRGRHVCCAGRRRWPAGAKERWARASTSTTWLWRLHIRHSNVICLLLGTYISGYPKWTVNTRHCLYLNNRGYIINNIYDSELPNICICIGGIWGAWGCIAHFHIIRRGKTRLLSLPTPANCNRVWCGKRIINVSRMYIIYWLIIFYSNVIFFPTQVFLICTPIFTIFNICTP